MFEEVEKKKMKLALAARRTLQRRRKLSLEPFERDGTYMTSRRVKWTGSPLWSTMDTEMLTVPSIGQLMPETVPRSLRCTKSVKSEDGGVVTNGTAIDYPE